MIGTAAFPAYRAKIHSLPCHVTLRAVMPTNRVYLGVLRAFLAGFARDWIPYARSLVRSSFCLFVEVPKVFSMELITRY
jgi:hypothetical protein